MGAIGFDGEAETQAACRGPIGSLNKWEILTANTQLALAA